MGSFMLAITGTKILISWGQTLSLIVGLIVALATLWKLMTMGINKKIESKADQKDLDHLSEKVDLMAKSTDEKFDIIIDQFKELRVDLRLKKDKDGS